jgi:hypothetical protein
MLLSTAENSSLDVIDTRHHVLGNLLQYFRLIMSQ